MAVGRRHARDAVTTLLLVSVLLAACGEAASPTAPAAGAPGPTAAPTIAPPRSVVPALAARSSPAGAATPMVGTAGRHQASPVVPSASEGCGCAGPPVVATDQPSPVVFVRKIDTSAHPLLNPGALAVDHQGNVYVLDHALYPQIQKYDAEGRFVTKWGNHGTGDGQFQFVSRTTGNQLRDEFNGGLAVDRSGNIWVADSHNSRVQIFDPNGTFLAKFGSRGTGDGQFTQPTSLAFDSEGNVHIGDRSWRVQTFDPSGRFLATFGRPGSGDGEFYGPCPGAVDSQGNIYVADAMNARIQRLDRDGNFLAKWGSRGGGEGQFNRPVRLVLDGQGHLYVADSSRRIQQFDLSGKFLGQWSDPGNGDPPFAGEITALAVDAQGNIYVAQDYRVEPGARGIYVFRPR